MATITEHEVVYANNKKIHYLASGPVDGPLILFIHGWPATAVTWKPQIETFSMLGFRVVAPDMPGYGKSTARRITEDYCCEAIVQGMMALLAHTGRDAAIWVGHDWGAGITSSVATQHPEAVKSLVNLCVPYRSIELGWDGFLPFVNREIYPTDKYEFGQWDYMKLYEEDFEQTIEWFDRNIVGFCKAAMQNVTPQSTRIAPVMSSVRKDGGWEAMLGEMPSDKPAGSLIVSRDILDSFVEDMLKTGFWTGSSYYMHHKRNAEYNGKITRKLKQPVLFIHATWDLVCDTKTSRLAEPMREACSNLTEVTVDSGHLVHLQKSEAVNSALARFIMKELPSEWPGFWDSGYVKREPLL